MVETTESRVESLPNRKETPVPGALPPAPPTVPSRSPETKSESLAVQVYLGLSQSDRLAVGVLTALVVVLLAVHWTRLSGFGSRPVEIEHLPPGSYEDRIDINSATWVEWMQLEAIGESTARRIVEDRERNGPFQSIDDLQRVPGIGHKTVEKIRPHLRVDDENVKESGLKGGPR